MPYFKIFLYKIQSIVKYSLKRHIYLIFGSKNNTKCLTGIIAVAAGWKYSAALKFDGKIEKTTATEYKASAQMQQTEELLYN